MIGLLLSHLPPAQAAVVYRPALGKSEAFRDLRHAPGSLGHYLGNPAADAVKSNEIGATKNSIPPGHPTRETPAH